MYSFQYIHDTTVTLKNIGKGHFNTLIIRVRVNLTLNILVKNTKKYKHASVINNLIDDYFKKCVVRKS